MKNEQEIPYRVYRMVNVKKLDDYYYEKGDLQRTHTRIYEQAIMPLFGICPNTHLDYRNASDELLQLYPQMPYIDVTLWTLASLLKSLTVAETNKFYQFAQQVIGHALSEVKRNIDSRFVTADMLLQEIFRAMCRQGFRTGM